MGNAIAFAASASAVRSIVAEKIITCSGKRVEFVACRRRGNVNAHHPRTNAIKPLEIRQTAGVETSNNPNSGGMIEPNVTMNPSCTQVRATKVSNLVICPPSICRTTIVKTDKAANDMPAAAIV